MWRDGTAVRIRLTSVGSGLASVGSGLAELVLPGGCAGCGAAALRYGVCGACADLVTGLAPHPTRPDPAPAGLPPAAALGDYTGVLRELVLSYKDRGRHRLAVPLGRLLARVVAHLLDERAVAGPVVLVPVPDTAAAARARHGDHLWRLARPAATRLRSGGGQVALARPLRSLPRPDSAGLDTRQRAAAALASLRLRPLAVAALRRRLARTSATLILLDDVVTTGATLAAATSRLAAAGIPVAAIAVLAATQRTHPVRRAAA